MQIQRAPPCRPGASRPQSRLRWPDKIRPPTLPTSATPLNFVWLLSPFHFSLSIFSITAAISDHYLLIRPSRIPSPTRPSLVSPDRQGLLSHLYIDIASYIPSCLPARPPPLPTSVASFLRVPLTASSPPYRRVLIPPYDNPPRHRCGDRPLRAL